MEGAGVEEVEGGESGEVGELRRCMYEHDADNDLHMRERFDPCACVYESVHLLLLSVPQHARPRDSDNDCT